MSIKKYIECWKWQLTIMRDPCDPFRDFKERMNCLFSKDKSEERKEDKKDAS